MVWPFILSLISLSTFPLVTSKSMTHEIFYALHLAHEGTSLIIRYLSLVSLHFFHPITLAYVTSRVLRPPWGHEIRRYLWQSSLGQVFGRLVEVWSLLCSLLWKILLEAFGLSLAWHIDVWWIFGFGNSSLRILDSSFGCALDIHTGAYSPFIWLRWAPSGALSLSLVIFTDQRSLVGCVEIISVLVEHRWAPSVSICGVFLR